MKIKLSFTCLLFISFSSFSQIKIKLPEDSFQITNRKFYVTEVVDKRSNKDYIGEIWKGAFKKPEKITVEGGIDNYLQNWFLSNFPKTSEQQEAVKVFIKNITITQSATYSQETGEAYVEFDFIDNSNKRHKFYSKISEETGDAFSTHPQRLITAFKNCVIKFNNSIKETTVESNTNYEENADEIVFDNGNNIDKNKYETKTEKVRVSENRNVIAVGYMIGGYNLLGVDYEVRLHDYFGIHFGAGFVGYTAGIKIHTNKKKNSMFFNASWKDAGLGTMNGFALEAGGRWIWSKKRDFGLYYQAGFFNINYIDDNLASYLFDSSVPDVILSMGIGISW